MYQYNISYIIRPNDVDAFKIFFAENIKSTVFDANIDMQFWKLINEQGNDTVTISQQMSIKSLTDFVTYRPSLELQLQDMLDKFDKEVLFFTTLMKQW